MSAKKEEKMSNIKGLYFKLNMEKERDKIIYNFFNTLDVSDNKIETLCNLIFNYLSMDEIDELAAMSIDNKDGTEHEQNK